MSKEEQKTEPNVPDGWYRLPDDAIIKFIDMVWVKGVWRHAVPLTGLITGDRFVIRRIGS